MSGGSWDYAHAKVTLAALELFERETRHRTEVHPLRRELIDHLYYLADVMKAIEWSDSGDTAPDDWVEKTQAFLDKYKLVEFPPNRQIREGD